VVDSGWIVDGKFVTQKDAGFGFHPELLKAETDVRRIEIDKDLSPLPIPDELKKGIK